jgi:hypothetical protein
MQHYIKYNAATGEILETVIAEKAEYLSPVTSAFTYVETDDSVDNSKYYFDLGASQTTAFPDKPDANYVWNWTTKAWYDPRTEDQKYEQLVKAAKEKRARMLAASDWVVVKSVDQGAPVPQDWQTYRQALRDITTQSGYPATIVWPTSPQ